MLLKDYLKNNKKTFKNDSNIFLSKNNKNLASNNKFKKSYLMIIIILFWVKILTKDKNNTKIMLKPKSNKLKKSYIKSANLLLRLIPLQKT